MTSAIARLAILALVAGFAAGCANTIRGVGQDTAAAVDATQRAGADIEAAAD